MDNFNLKTYLAEGRLYKETFINEVSDEDIKAAAAKVLGVKPEELEAKNDQIDEGGALTAITIMGLIPPAMELLGGAVNKTKQWLASDSDKGEIKDLDTKIEKVKALVKKLDKENVGQSPEEKKARKLLKQLKSKKDKEFGSDLGNWFKEYGHKLHHIYVLPLEKFLKLVSKFSKKDSKLRNDEYREKIANIIYATIMAGLAGYGALSHLGHLKGVSDVAVTIADAVKGGKSIKDILSGVLKLV